LVQRRSVLEIRLQGNQSLLLLARVFPRKAKPGRRVFHISRTVFI
jgi:hypothetical protein